MLAYFEFDTSKVFQGREVLRTLIWSQAGVGWDPPLSETQDNVKEILFAMDCIWFLTNILHSIIYTCVCV